MTAVGHKVTALYVERGGPYFTLLLSTRAR